MQTLLLILVPLLFGVPAHSAPLPTFKARLHDDLATLDWGYGEVNGEVVYQLMDGLFKADRDGRPQPNVAKSYKWDAEQTELELHLGASRWSDGKEVCAQDFVDAWTRLRDKAFASPYAHYAAPFDSFSAHGCHDLTIRFKRATPEATYLLTNLVFFPVRLDNLKTHPKAFTEGTTLLVNGPFKVASWELGSRIRLERNPKYAGKKPKLERVEFLFIAEDSTAKTMFETKELDWVKEVPQLLRTPELEKSGELKMYPSLIEYYFGLNAGKAEILKDSGVRHALSAALDRSEIQKILGKECVGIDSWLEPVFHSGHHAGPPLLDPKAVERIKVAADKGTLGLALHTYSKTSHKLLAEWAQGQWEKKLGVRIPLVVEESRVYWKDVSENPLPIFFGGVTAPYGHPRAFLQEFLQTSTANWTGWKSADYDAAVASEKFGAAEEILERDGWVIPLYRRDTVALVREKWRGFYINPLGQVYLADVY
jgi:oligopeptide transport system substrate-binding protein